jgi:hypothetical protein
VTLIAKGDGAIGGHSIARVTYTDRMFRPHVELVGELSGAHEVTATVAEPGLYQVRHVIRNRVWDEHVIVWALDDDTLVATVTKVSYQDDLCSDDLLPASLAREGRKILIKELGEAIKDTDVAPDELIEIGPQYAAQLRCAPGAIPWCELTTLRQKLLVRLRRASLMDRRAQLVEELVEKQERLAEVDAMLAELLLEVIWSTPAGG